MFEMIDRLIVITTTYKEIMEILVFSLHVIDFLYYSACFHVYEYVLLLCYASKLEINYIYLSIRKKCWNSY